MIMIILSLKIDMAVEQMVTTNCKQASYDRKANVTSGSKFIANIAFLYYTGYLLKCFFVNAKNFFVKILACNINEDNTPDMV